MLDQSSRADIAKKKVLVPGYHDLEQAGWEVEQAGRVGLTYVVKIRTLLLTGRSDVLESESSVD